MNTLEIEVDNMSLEVEAVLVANGAIVDSIATLSAASDEVSANANSCKDTIDEATTNLGVFADKVEGTFTELMQLAEVTSAE